MPERYADLSIIQRKFIETLTDERVTQIVEAGALLRDLSADGREFLRSANDVTFHWLKQLRPEEIQELNNAIRLVIAFRTTGTIVRWAVVSLFAAFIGSITIWDRVSAWLRGR